MSEQDRVRIVADDRISKRDAVNAATEAAEDFLRELPDSDYVEACDEIANYFETCAAAKREEWKRDGKDEG